MALDTSTGAASVPASDPHPVSRGSKIQPVFTGIDSLYLVIEYPHRDLFDQWSLGLGDLLAPALFDGIEAGGFIIRRGGNGYKLSVWDGDARLFLTDRVADEVEVNNGPMGVMLQLGPKWLRRYGDEPISTLKRNIIGQLIAFGMINPEQFKIRVNRVDFTLDVADLSTDDLRFELWPHLWVGYASPRAIYFSALRSGTEGIKVGSAYGIVHLRVYDKMQESKRDKDHSFWRSVWGESVTNTTSVTRFEWAVRVYEGKYKDCRYLDELTAQGLDSVWNYASSRWGRLAVSVSDTNRSRWPDAPIWSVLRGYISEWTFNEQTVAKRDYDLSVDISDEYLCSMAGWFAGLQARVAVNKDQPTEASVTDALQYLHEHGQSFESINRKAREKAHRLAILLGKARGGS